MVATVKYEIVKKLIKVEIRQYPNIVIARVEGYEDEGFGLLFRFISGENKQKAKVKMTAPVVSQQIGMTAPVLSDTGSMAFVMPEEYRIETTPEPLDNRVKIIEIPARTMAALRFSGRWSESLFKAKTKELLDELTNAKIKTKGNVFTMLYNAPYTPWFMRRNEVAIEVKID
jgi:effector-binding domain-containing protein